MKLLIDAGNSRVKWGVHDGAQWLAQGAVKHDEISSLQQDWAVWPITMVLGAMVAGERVREALTAVSPLPIDWISPLQEGFGVMNHYHHPELMGVDRWLAVLAARALYPEEHVLVVCAGTALTIESLEQTGDYLGGEILPGYLTMLTSLARNTARLDKAPGRCADFPRCTEDAIATGVLDAMTGAIDRARARLAAYTGSMSPLVLVTGGDAPLLAPLLARPAQIVDNLVLIGLLKVSNES
jgi:type III pantothenate kinase